MHEEAAGCPRAGHAAGPGPAPDAGDWYANLHWLDRPKCLLITHSDTLFSVFEADVRAADLRGPEDAGIQVLKETRMVPAACADGHGRGRSDGGATDGAAEAVFGLTFAAELSVHGPHAASLPGWFPWDGAVGEGRVR